MSFNLTVDGGFDLYQTPTTVTFEILKEYETDCASKCEADFKVLEAYKRHLQSHLFQDDPELLEEHIDRLRRHVMDLHTQSIFGVFSYI